MNKALLICKKYRDRQVMTRSFGNFLASNFDRSFGNFLGDSKYLDFSRCLLSETPDYSFGFQVIPDFISDTEHDTLLHDADSFLARRTFSNDHFDGVISGYREGLLNLKEGPQNLIQLSKRVYNLFPKTSSPLMPSIHFIELQKSGQIGKHVDSIKFSGSVVAGISLASDCVMHLYPVKFGSDGSEKNNDPSLLGVVDVLLPKKSLYIMSHESRYHWAHEIRSGEPTFLKRSVPRQRRVSMIFRDVLDPTSPPDIVNYTGTFAEKVFSKM